MDNTPIFLKVDFDTMSVSADPDDMEVGFIAVTSDIRVMVRSFWLDDQSQPNEHRFTWAYRIRVENHSEEIVRLINCSWTIINSNGLARSSQGDGIGGEQPQLEPGEAFEYVSSVMLSMPSGFMQGHYKMLGLMSGKTFDITVPTFSLDSPHQLSRLIH